MHLLLEFRGYDNVIATNNEFQRQEGVPISKDTNLTFDVWQSNGTAEGTCVGNILVTIDGGGNQRAEIVLEDHLAIYYTGGTAEATAKIQLYDNAGKFIGVATELIGQNSSVVTDDVLTLSYKDLDGNSIAASTIPKEGGGYLRILGLDDDETEASCMILYTKAKPDVAGGAWDNIKLASTTITFARRNGGNDPLGLAE